MEARGGGKRWEREIEKGETGEERKGNKGIVSIVIWEEGKGGEMKDKGRIERSREG